MKARDEILEAARRLAAQKPLHQISLSDVAKETGKSWPTVRRHVGSREELRALLENEKVENANENPDTRTRILAAAERVFARYGFSGATLDQVAADAGLTKGAVYWHFKSKSDLYLALLEERIEHQLASLPEVIWNLSGATSAEPALASLLKSQIDCCKDPDQPRLFWEFVVKSREPEVQERLCSIYRVLYQRVRELIRELQEAGLLAGDQDPYVLSVYLSAVFDGLAVACMIDPELVDLNTLAPELARIMWRGIGPVRGL
ncbi:TetR/AcrR family transcriptional regulator [Effusibacillus consociatus]|uniref:TetR/AcrR family transcriptional regulator n=1 Tax=Effusibacillus consociatus TaxID=1117041 RepID=A0ABV9Q5Y5_9BACL